MYGPDVERLLKTANDLKEAIEDQIWKMLLNDWGGGYESFNVLGGKTYMLTDFCCNAPPPPGPDYQEDEVAVGDKPTNRRAYDIYMKSWHNTLFTITFLSQHDELESIKNVYSGYTNYNNGYGSPWTESDEFIKAVNKAYMFVSMHPFLLYLGDKMSYATLLNTALTLLLDYKWSLCQYADRIQRGFDALGEGSVKFDTTMGTSTDGNVKYK